MVQLVLMVVLLVVVAIPFLVNAMRDSQALNRTGFRPMRLIRRISEDDVIAEFLKSDFENEAYSDYHQTLREMVYEPDLGDQSEDAKRRALLFLRHRSLWKELPEDTEWYEAEVTTEDLKQIQVFPRAHWRKIARGNFSIVKVVERIRSWEREKQTTFVEKITNIRQGLLQRESNRGSVLLIGLNEMEPMTILDGNHRLVAAVLEGKVDRLRFVCGLSPGMTRCCWYRTNLVNLVGYGSNLLRHVVHRPGADLERLCETSNRNKAWQQ
jgi:hypothetical protein